MKNIILLFFAFMSTTGFSQECEKPKYLVCSITIGSENEISVFKSQAGVENGSNLSGDKCIMFHEFVRPNDPWNPATRTYAWHQEMMEVGASSWPKKTCDLLLVSGHHDFGNNNGEYPAGYQLKRNQFVYSNKFYAHEASYPPLPTGGVKHSPPAMTSVSPGPRLLLPQLARSAPVCNNRYDIENFNGNINYHPTWTPESGKVLLSDLLSVFLFACNFSANAAEDAGKMNTGEIAVRLPTNTASEDRDTVLQKYSFQARTQIIFGTAVKLYTFPKTAPLGSDNEDDVVDFLRNFMRKKKYGDKSNFMTLYLDDLRSLKNSGLSVSQYSLTQAGLLPPPMSPFLSQCKQRSAPDCSCIETARDGRCIQECGLDASDRREIKDAYCGGMKKFYELWKAKSSRDTGALIRRNRLVAPFGRPENGAFVNGPAERASEAEVTPYDLEWFY